MRFNQDDESEWHYKLFGFPPMLLLELFGALRELASDPRCSALALPVVDWDIPRDARIRGVQYDFERNLLVVRVVHPSWPAVEPGERVPIIWARSHRVLPLGEALRT